MNSDFENQLQRQAMREVPSQWRGRILGAAGEPAPSRGWLEWLWPCPQAWGALAVIWALIIGLDLGTAAGGPKEIARVIPPMSGEALREYRQQQEILVQLIFSDESRPDASKKNLPGRSELKPGLLERFRRDYYLGTARQEPRPTDRAELPDSAAQIT